jgi:hypothetical protein
LGGGNRYLGFDLVQLVSNRDIPCAIEYPRYGTVDLAVVKRFDDVAKARAFLWFALPQLLQSGTKSALVSLLPTADSPALVKRPNCET